jgi:hypothetical protein
MDPTVEKDSSAPSAEPTFQFDHFEQCFCTRCDSVIAQKHIVANIMQGDLGRARRSMKAWCEHCDTLYSLELGLSNGCWFPIAGTLKVVNNPSQLHAFAKRLALINGDVQVGNGRRAS